MKESLIQSNIRKFMWARGWLSLNMHGNAFQKGIPDTYSIHPTHGPRWIEAKKPKGYSFTKWQLIVFPIIERFGGEIWILSDDTMSEYRKLWEAPNWRSYLKPRHLKLIDQFAQQRWLTSQGFSMARAVSLLTVAKSLNISPPQYELQTPT